jgi:hypothetical protein
MAEIAARGALPASRAHAHAAMASVSSRRQPPPPGHGGRRLPMPVGLVPAWIGATTLAFGSTTRSPGPKDLGHLPLRP